VYNDLAQNVFLPRLNGNNQLELEMLKERGVINSFLKKRITSFAIQMAAKLPKCDTFLSVVRRTINF